MTARTLPRFPRKRTFLGLACALCPAAAPPANAAASSTPPPTPTPEQLEFFEAKIRPVLVDKCFECHSSTSKSVKAGLLLDSREAWLKGGESGPALDLKEPGASLALKALSHADPELLMPPKKAGGKLPAAVLSDFETWVKQGAPWPAETRPAGKVAAFDLKARKQEHWCWQPPVAGPLPGVRNAAWPLVGPDRFILAELEAKNLKPAPDTDKATWLRRVSFDLTGLPPSPEELRAFLADKSPHAHESVVDRLLHSPHFGERWARHWMDLVRYAESRGHEFDPVIPGAWRYRDYLVRAFNADLPYPEFVKEHIAGDLLPARLDPATGASESVPATGFWVLGEEVHSPVDIRQDEADRMDNRLDTMTKSFLGLTVACARCHDHKFDAISQKDYYALTGFLLSSSNRVVRFETLESERKISQELAALETEARGPLLKALAEAIRPGLNSAAQHLLAAAQTSAAAPPAPTPQKTEQPAPETPPSWSGELQAALASPRHPLHLFASAAPGPERLLAAKLQAALPRVLGAPVKPTGTGSHQLIADYTAPGKTPWMQDGFAFGTGPASPGNVLLGESPDAPLRGVLSSGSARRQELWKSLESLGDPEVGGLKDFKRSGQTLRTPEFTVSDGPVWILCRGAGRSYASVDSHLIIHGPLHGRLLLKWQGDADWKWVQHNLKDYQGHRAHLQLVPEGTGDFEVALVLQGGEAPPLPQSPASLAALVPFTSLSSAPPSAGNAPSLLEELEPRLSRFSNHSDLVQALEQTLLRTADAMARNALAGDAPLAVWADWCVRRLDLLCPPDSDARRALAESARPWITKAAAIRARFQPKSQTATAMFEGSGVDEFLLKRGSSRMPQGPVPRRFLEALAGPEPLNIPAGSGRRELAELIASPANPLTSRVLVNRVWHHLFGRGIVPSVDNFGVLGQPPSHPALLDHLAVRFSGEFKGSLKGLLRELVLSRTYRMSSKPQDAASEEADPENILLHRMNLKRLQSESIRDALLAVSGRLNPAVGGPSVPVHLTPFMMGRGRPPGSGPLDGDGRRSIYTAIKRNFLSPMMLAFDMPIPFAPMGRRNVSNVPAQALVLMNDPFVLAEAARWAASLPATLSAPERIQLLYVRAFSREATPTEVEDALQFIAEQKAELAAAPPARNAPAPEAQAWTDLCHALFNAKEFIHVN